jgi:hypothetical protein
MTSLDHPGFPQSLAASRPILLRIAPALYATTLFASALLLFAVQPMFARIVLPRLGGSPSVWSVAMVFFQTALLAGYAHAHVLTRRLGPGRAALVHMGVLAAAAATLPLAIAAGFGAPPAEGVTLWLFALFAASIGLPFAVLSATAPLLQNWFAASGHPQARNPYVLYAASNLGSFAALIAYPALIEPLLTLTAQTALWSAGFALVALLIAMAATVAATAGATRAASQADSAAPTAAERMSWIALAAIPSGLTIGLTAHISTDVAAAPFLWVIPLALYLLTFVAIFRDRPWVPHAWVVRLVPFTVAPLAVALLGGDRAFWFAAVSLNILVFVLLTLLCHGRLYARRPAPARLTEFYLWVSLGGVLGGAFAGLIAPHVFDGTYEYPILISLAVLALPGALADSRRFLREALPGLALAGGAVALRLLGDADLSIPSAYMPWYQIGLVFLIALMLLSRTQPARLFSLVALAFVITELWRPGIRPIETARSFFGVHRVGDAADGKVRLLFHGTTMHGAQRIRADDGGALTGRPQSISYYYAGGPISDAVDSARLAQKRLDQAAIIGLGTGSLACHRRGGERWTFFDIDPMVARIARDPKLFNFLTECAPDAPIVIGDARLTIAQPGGPYNLLVLDAFSSDAIPVHLLTREAFTSYLAKLSPQGVIAAHISNRHMDLAPTVAAIGHALGLVAYLKEDAAAGSFLTTFKSNARVVVLARKAADLGDLPARAGWSEMRPDPTVQPWTDDYSNLLEAIWRKKAAR